MRDALFLIAGVPPLLRRHDFGAYQLESKGFSEGPQKWATRRGSVSGRYIALRVAISPFLISEPYDGPPCQPGRQGATRLLPCVRMQRAASE